jgi:ICE2
MWLTRVLGSVVFLSAIILSIPLAYDVGGRACGLAYSLALSTFYFFYSVLRICTPDDARMRGIFVQLIALTQWLILPSLLLWAIGRFGVDPEKTRSWTEWTFGVSSKPDTSVGEWVFGPGGLVENVVLGVWDNTLRWSTPVFQLCEGFCSLLVIQAAGQITRWVVNRTSRSDGWMVGNLFPLILTANGLDRSLSSSSPPLPSPLPSTSFGG